MSASRLRKHRERLACAECRQRKLKCARQSPCGSCVRRRDATSCFYEVFNDRSDRDRLRHTQAPERLEHLEQLVGLLAGQRSVTTNKVQYVTPAAELPQGLDIAEPTIASSSSRSDLCYQAGSGTTHWSAMLDEIQALRSTLDPLEDNDTCDGDFQRQCEAFWSDPTAAPPLRISILFPILSITTDISRTGREDDIPGHEFTVAAAQCLALGECFRPKAFWFETLLLYVQSHFVTCLEVSPDMGTLLSMLAHIVTVSGYHRESSVSGLSPFAAEMRRRAWSTFMQLNILVSAHIGVPSTITLKVSDTCAPSNLLDSDSDEESARLPSSKPNTELTGMTFCIIKHRFMTIFDRILQHALMGNSHEAIDTHIDSLNTELKHLYETLPDWYRSRPIENCVNDQPRLIVARLCISFVYHKSLCVLHRPHFIEHRARSIRECFAASSASVTDLLRVYEECKPGGQLETEKWYVKSITWHDFLLNLTTLCLVAYATSQAME
ncbi:transcription activator acu-15 [Fusarium heterosporum]|uniref:Transcription activator acu-15 n=1 Tax=Fusarium heterosporum TaxID=42747 RepID=A0A8H5WEP8_FUSHE|nr:transcription activator acu-15 [Fusarium heterosporum]